ncbi:hypothetical protein ABK040_008147 [Willaertia magna]
MSEDQLEKEQEIEVLRSIYWDDLEEIEPNVKYSIKIKPKIDFNPEEELSLLNQPYLLAHTGLTFEIEYPSEGYPSQKSVKFNIKPSHHYEDILNKSTAIKEEEKLAVECKKNLQNEELEEVNKILMEKANEIISQVMVYSLIQELDEYLERKANEISIEDSEKTVNEYVKSNKKVSGPVIVKVSMSGETSIVENQTLVNEKKKQQLENVQQKRNIQNYNSPNFKDKNSPVVTEQKNSNSDEVHKKKEVSRNNANAMNIKVFECDINYASVEQFIELENYFKVSIEDRYLINRYLHSSVFIPSLRTVFIWGGIYLGEFSNDLIAMKYSRFNEMKMDEESKPFDLEITQLRQKDRFAPPVIFHTLNSYYSSNLVLIGGISDIGVVSNLAYMYVIERSQWDYLPMLPFPICGHATIIYGDDLYLFGGWNGVEFSDVLLHFNFIKKVWTKVEYSRVSETPSPRAGCSCFVDKNILYVYGGCDKYTYYNDLYAFDLNLKYWSKVFCFGPSPFIAYAGPFLQGTTSNTVRLYGGFDGKDWSTSLYEYNIQTRIWTTHILKKNKTFDGKAAFSSCCDFVSQHLIMTGGCKGSTFKIHDQVTHAIKQKTDPPKHSTVRLLQKHLKLSSSLSNRKKLSKVYSDWFLTQNENDSDVIFRFFERNVNNEIKEKKIIACHKLVLENNPVLSKLVSVEEYKAKLKEKVDNNTHVINSIVDYLNDEKITDVDIIQGRKIIIDIQTIRGFENVTYNSLFSAIHFLYSLSFNTHYCKEDKDAKDLFDIAFKLRMNVLCELLCNCVNLSRLREENISTKMSGLIPKFLQISEVTEEEQEFLQTREDYEMFECKDENYVNTTGLVRLIAPDLNSRLGIKEEEIEEDKFKEEEQLINIDNNNIPVDLNQVEDIIEQLDKKINHLEIKESETKENTKLKKKNNYIWKSIIAHKGILINQSEYFKSMFELDFSESKRNEIRINEISIQSLEVILSWMYTNYLPTLSVNNAMEIYIAVNQFCLNDLKDWVRTFIEKHIDEENVCTVLDIAEMMGDNALRSNCIFYIARNYDYVEAKDPMFKHLSFSVQFEIKTLKTKHFDFIN